MKKITRYYEQTSWLELSMGVFLACQEPAPMTGQEESAQEKGWSLKQNKEQDSPNKIGCQSPIGPQSK